MPTEPADASMTTDQVKPIAIGFGVEPRAAYASEPSRSRGRLVAEAESPTRTPFQRDRDRIVHSTAFRRLAYKTQVFLFHEGDHYRNRLTHTIEVAQIARALARALRLDEDLAEALALGHDLGHTPFGHAGERAMQRAMAAWGGFDHNAQTLRVVTSLDRRYADFDGLNLTWETLEGLVKHNGPLADRSGAPLHADGIPWAIARYQAEHDLDLASHAGPEAQAAAISDDIAYDAHDIDDGLRAGLIVPDDLAGLPVVGDILAEVRRRHPDLELARLIQEVTRRIITRMVEDVIRTASERLRVADPSSADAVRALGAPVVTLSEPMAAADRAIKALLYERVYRSADVMRVMWAAEKVVENLHAAYCADPREMPLEWRRGTDACDPAQLARRVADYIAGMTDRFALAEHKRLFDAAPELR
jgi:dGTPase